MQMNLISVVTHAFEHFHSKIKSHKDVTKINK